MGLSCCNKNDVNSKNVGPNKMIINKIKTREEINSNKSYSKNEKLLKIKTLGKGGFAKVEQVETLDSKRTYALKKTPLDCSNKVKTIVEEKKLLSVCHHPNIISVKDIFKEVKYNTINMVLEYVDGGALRQQLDGKNIEEHTLLFWFIQICLALSYLKHKQIIHRDIKPENILLSETGLIKLGDFGLSIKSNSKIKNIAGTRRYMAPEVKTGIYDEKVDIYSLGKTINEFIILNRNYSKEFVQLIDSLMETDPNKRLSADEILNVPIIKSEMELILNNNNEKCLANLIMKNINIDNENYNNEDGYDNFIRDIKKERKNLIENNSEYNNKGYSKDLDIIMCIISKIIKKNKEKSY